MHFTKHTLAIALLLCIVSQMHGMQKRKRDETSVEVTRSNRTKTLQSLELPDEMAELILMNFFHGTSGSSGNENAIPAVCQQWNLIANSPSVIKEFNPLHENNDWYPTLTSIRHAPFCPKARTAWSKLHGFKTYKKANGELWAQCLKNAPTTEIEKTLKNPYANVNYPKWHISSYPQTPLYAAVESYNPKLVKFLIKHNADVANQVSLLDHGLLLNSFWGIIPADKIDAHIKCIRYLLEAGAEDNHGAALHQIAKKTHFYSKYNSLIPLFTNTKPNQQFNSVEKNTALHELIHPMNSQPYNEESIITLLTKFDADPTIPNANGDTAYDFASCWEDENLMQLLEKNDPHNR